MSREDHDGFLGRWSARKLDARSPGRPEEPDGPDAEPAQENDVADKSDAEILEELGLPDPEDMGRDDDFSAFMKTAVPARLRNRALRRLWLTDPVLANLDELVDYGDDFTDAATVVENIATVYRVGRGMAGPTKDEAASGRTPDERGEPVASATEDGDSGAVGGATNAAESTPEGPVTGGQTDSEREGARAVSTPPDDGGGMQDKNLPSGRADANEGPEHLTGNGDDPAGASGRTAGSIVPAGGRPRRMRFVFTSG